MAGAILIMVPVPHIMGIMNLTPDSFSDGGHIRSVEAAVAMAEVMIAEGAAIIDLGGESTRPGASLVPVEEELRRVEPVMRQLAKVGIPFSIDSRKAAVMELAAGYGATMLNDVSALSFDNDSLRVAAESRADVVLMHMAGVPESMQDAPEYDNVVAEVIAWLAARIALCEAAGLSRARLIADPGIGFGKTLRHNLDLMRGLERLRHALDVQLLLGASRKSLIPAIAGPSPASERLGGSIALAIRAAEAGCTWVRVHDVAETRQALLVWQACQD